MLETRRELGSSYDAALVDSFADRIEAAVVARAAGEVGARTRADRAHEASRTAAARARHRVRRRRASRSPRSAWPCEGGPTGLVAMMVGWGGLVGINAAHALQARGRAVSR